MDKKEIEKFIEDNQLADSFDKPVLIEGLQKLLDKAREEGRREVLEQIQRVLEDEMLVIAKDGTGVVEKYINEWLNNLSDKRV